MNNVRHVAEPLTTATNLSFKCDNLSAEQDNEAEDVVKIIPAYTNMSLFQRTDGSENVNFVNDPR